MALDTLLVWPDVIARPMGVRTAPVSVPLRLQWRWRCTGDPTPAGALAVDAEYNRLLGAGPDVREGVSAFLEKRAPNFPGKVSSDMPVGYPWWK